jgi:hypothetical protein
LKKAWVEKTKIKSKWKAQKKKEGLATSSKLDLPVYDDEERDKDNSRSNSDDVQPVVEISGEQPRPHHLHPSRAHIHPELPVHHSKARIPEVPPTKNKKISEDSQAVEPPSLRELKREAYSQSTLHTFKSDPLIKHKQGKRVSGRGRGNGFIERGRGQPNMKLRMNVMLEKIKQNFA